MSRRCFVCQIPSLSAALPSPISLHPCTELFPDASSTASCFDLLEKDRVCVCFYM